MRRCFSTVKRLRNARIYDSVMSEALRDQKRALRKAISGKLGELDTNDIASQSSLITRQILSLDQYQKARAISVFLSMPGREASTNEIVLDALRNRKQVFVPYIRPKSKENPSSMEMLQISDEADFQSLKPDAWAIPSLDPASVEDRRNAIGGQGIRKEHTETANGSPRLDVVLMPAVAFDRSGNRLGHGKGFYDRYLQKYRAAVDGANSRMPLLVGLALREQLLSPNENIPHDEDDWRVNLIVSPDSAVEPS